MQFRKARVWRADVSYSKGRVGHNIALQRYGIVVLCEGNAGYCIAKVLYSPVM